MAKTKEEIFREHWAKWANDISNVTDIPFEPKDCYSLQGHPGLPAMDEFARQECIEFAKWIDLNNIGTVAIMDYPIHLSTDAPDELYQLFINSKIK